MAYQGQTHIVRGAYKTTHVVRFPMAGEMFQDETRQQIVNISLMAHGFFLEASLLDEENPARLAILRQAIETRQQEKARWLALQPPDEDGAWKADLAIASYLGQSGKMVAAFDQFMRIRTGAPENSLVCQTATANLKQMFEQVRSQIGEVGPLGEALSTEQLKAVRDFWVRILPE